MTGILFFIKRCFWFLWDNPRILIVALAVLLLLVIGLQMRGCFRAKPKLNQQEIIELQKAIATEDRKAMEKILIDSDVREKQIDGNVVNAKMDTVNAIADAKKKASQMSNEELAAELERRAREE